MGSARVETLLILLLVVCGASARNLKVAWLAPSSANSQGIQAASSVSGLALALRDIQSDSSLLPGDTFTVVWRDSGCDSKTAIGAMYNLSMDSYQFDVVIGPPCSTAMEPISELTSTRNISVIGWFSNEASLADKARRTTLIRVYGSTDAMGIGLQKFADEFNWKLIFLISSNYTTYQETADGINKVFASTNGQNYTVARWTQEVTLDPTIDEMTSIYSNVQREARVVMLCVPRTEIRRWMLAAADMDMTGGDYVFIFLDADLPTQTIVAYYTTESLWRQNDGRDQEARQAFENLLIMTPQPFEQSQIDAFRQKAEQAVQDTRLDTQLGMNATTPDSYSPFLHDAMLLYAKLAQENPTNYNKGEVLRQAASNRVFQGSEWKSSDMVLDTAADRYPIFVVYDLQAEGVFGVAYTVGYTISDGDVQRSVTKSKDIRWGNGMRGTDNVPPDTPECGFRNENCPVNLGVYIGPSVAGLVVIIFIIIAFLVYRRIQYEKEISNMHWKVHYYDLKFRGKGKAGSEGFRSLGKSVEHMGSRRSLGRSAERVGSRATVASSVVSGESVSSQVQLFATSARYKGGVVAVKHVRKTTVKTDRDLMLEMQKMSEMKHTNLTLFIGACVEPPAFCSVWEYCPKGSLQDIIWNENIDLDDMFKFSLAIDITSGLLYLHDSPLKMHGRLKSSDCVIDGRWVCKLTDFGLVHFRADEHLDPDISHHKKYWYGFWSAPEVLRQWDENGRIPLSSTAGDVYGLAVILKEIFARNGPYTELEDDGTEPREIILAIKNPKEGKILRPTLETGVVLDGLRKTMALCWSEDPDNRPSASVVLRSLKRVNPYQKSNVMDNMITMMEKHSQHLEEIVKDRTVKLQEEKEKSDSLLYRMMPKSVAENLKRGNPIQAESFKQVTLYFSDIVGFNDMAAEITPYEVVDFLNAVYGLFDDVISDYDVYKVETVGDVYLLASGLPIRNEDRHVSEIANCSLDILSEALNFKVPHKAKHKLKIRIGIHTGPVVTGVIGLAMPRYCLFGDTVNTSSRMESTGAGGRIHMSPKAYEALCKFSGYHIADRGVIDVKGKGKLNTYWLIGKEGFEKLLPTFDEMFSGETNKPTKLPVTSGKSLRHRPSRISRTSSDSGMFDNDSRDPSRRTSAVDGAPAAEGRKISSEVIPEGSPVTNDNCMSDTAVFVENDSEKSNVETKTNDAVKTEESIANNALVGHGNVEQNQEEMWQKADTANYQVDNVEVNRPQTATKLVDLDTS